MHKWCVVYTQPQKEDVAFQNLIQQGFEVYYPRFKKIRRHARKVDEVLSPLFPRYIFVSIDTEVHAWRTVNGTRGVVYILSKDNVPQSMPYSVIESLKAKENENGIVPIESLSLFSEGDLVEITKGAFQGYKAHFEKFNGNQRAMILLEFLGRPMKVPISVGDIKPY
jgi:transcriptional antiterminator RfaH